MPLQYWSHGFQVATYLINRMPTPTLDMNSPYLNLFQSTPNYSKLRVFGSLCYSWLKPYSTNKLSPKSEPCVFLGYSSTQSAYLCLHVQTNKVFISCYVRFVESVFPFSNISLYLDRPQPTVHLFSFLLSLDYRLLTLLILLHR